MSSVVASIADWASATDRVSEEVRHAARRVLMDQVAVSLAGELRVPARTSSRPLATDWGTGERVHVLDAALANRLAGDDLELTAGPELGAAAVAAAEISQRALGDVWVAMNVGAAVESYYRAWLQPAVEVDGLHPPAVFGAVAAAAASAKLLRLAPEDFAGAIGNAWSLAPWSPYAAFSQGATGKWLYGAWSQRLGLSCALWARDGIHGAASTVEGTRGIARGLGLDPGAAPPFEPDDDALTRVTFKPYGCSRACHPALTALEAIGDIDPTRIARVEIWSYPFSVALDEWSQKSNPISRQMSVSATVAAALGTDAPVMLRAEGDDVLPRVRRARVRVLLANGEAREATAEAKWSGASPATDDELRARFLAGARGRRVFDPWSHGDDAVVSEVVRG